MSEPPAQPTQAQPTQAILFDIDARKFYLFDLVLWPQDTIYLVALLVLCALALFVPPLAALLYWRLRRSPRARRNAPRAAPPASSKDIWTMLAAPTSVRSGIILRQRSYSPISASSAPTWATYRPPPGTWMPPWASIRRCRKRG